MKKLFILIALSLSLASCNFLDVIPEGKPTTDDLYKTHIQTDKFACSLYWYMPNRYHFQSSLEICSGDMMSGFFGSVRYFKWKSMVYNNYESPSNTYVAMWSQGATSYPSGALTDYRIWEGIRNAYNLIDNADKLRGCDAYFSVIISAADEKLYKTLGINVCCEPKYEQHRYYHK